MQTAAISTLTGVLLIGCPATPEPSADSSEAKPTGPVASKPVAPTPPDGEASPLDSEAITAKRAAAKAKVSADQAQLEARRAQLLAALNDGRKLVADGELDQGIAKYRALLVIDPHYGPALGELGWALFKAGQLDSAHAYTLRALAAANHDNTRGMLLYNLGRIAEQRGQSELAIGHYRSSLAVRPNDTVAARLASLAAADVVTAPPAASDGLGGLTVLATGLADTPAMCAVAARDSLCGSGDCTLVAQPSGNTGLGVLHNDDMGMISCYHPVAQTPAGWVVFDNALLGQHGSEIDEDIDAIASRIEQTDAGEFLWIEFSAHVYERMWDFADLEGDDEIPQDDMTDREGIIICAIGPSPACTRPITRRYDFSGSDGTVTASYSASVALRGDLLVISEVRVTGQVELDAGGGIWADHLTLPAGEYPLTTLTTPKAP